MELIENYLKGGDLRSIGEVAKLVPLIKHQADFDELFAQMSSADRRIAMRAADAAERFRALQPNFLTKHKAAILALLDHSKYIELKWHVSQLIPRLTLNQVELIKVWSKLTAWVMDGSESKIVRVNALQAMADLNRGDAKLAAELTHLFDTVEKEGMPSLVARIRKLRLKQQ